MDLQRRKVTGFAVDGPTSKDLDDAILLSQDESGYTITVSISDVSSAVEKDSDLDKRALERAFTRYFAKSNNPMLPRRLSENLLSLIPGISHDVIVFEIRMSNELEVVDVKIELGQFKSKRRYTHKDVDDILEDQKHKEHELWMGYYKFAERLLNKRRAEGALVVYDLKKGLYTSEEGTVLRKQPGQYFRPYVIVQEFMILTNYAVTDFLGKQGVPLLYRNHASRASDVGEEKVLRELYGSYETFTPQLVEELGKRVRRLAERARYGSVLKGHFGLNLPTYAHWTSPIRRYADLVNHRQLLCWLSGKPFAYTSEGLQEVGDHINALVDEMRDATSNSYKAETQKGLKEANKEELLQLEPGHFSYFVRMITREEMLLTEQRLEVLVHKMQEKTLPLADYVRILFTEAPDESLWRKLRENALQALAANPDDVRATLSQAQQALGWESVVQHTQVGEGRFSVVVSITNGSRSYSSQAFEGKGKAEAETLAIIDLIRTVNKINIELPKENKTMEERQGNPKGQLLELCMKMKWANPIFHSSQQGPANQPIFTCIASLKVPNRDMLKTEPRQATSKKEAEQLASQAMLDLLGVAVTGQQQEGKTSQKPVSTENWKANPISALQELCQKKGAALPTYEDDPKEGPDHQPTFKVRCSVSVDGKSLTFQGKGSSKKEARKEAASEACKTLFAS